MGPALDLGRGPGASGVHGHQEPIPTKTAQLMARDPGVKASGKPGAPKGNQNAKKKKENKDANGTIVSNGSNHVSYLVRRLKRDAPKVAKGIMRKRSSTRSMTMFRPISPTVALINY